MAHFHYKRGMEYSLFVLFIFFASPSARLDFKRGKTSSVQFSSVYYFITNELLLPMKETKNVPFHACSRQCGRVVKAPD